jgi:hypothetical protein
VNKNRLKKPHCISYSEQQIGGEICGKKLKGSVEKLQRAAPERKRKRDMFLPRASRANLSITLFDAGSNMLSIAETLRKIRLRRNPRKEIAQYYEKLLGRPADNEGLSHWESVVQSGHLTLREVWEEIALMPEAQRRWFQ